MAAFVYAHGSLNSPLCSCVFDHVAKLYLGRLGSIRLLPIHKSGVFPDCHGLDADLVPSKISTIVLGGTAASHPLSVGGGNFFGKPTFMRKMGKRQEVRTIRQFAR